MATTNEVGTGRKTYSDVACGRCGGRHFGLNGFIVYGFELHEGREVEDFEHFPDTLDYLGEVTCLKCGHDCTEMWVDRYGARHDLVERRNGAAAAESQ